MEHADTAQMAAVLGAIGAALALLARGRVALLGGLALLALAELGLAYGVGGGGDLGSLTSPAALAAGVVGLAVLGGAAAFAVKRPGLVPLAVLIAAPFRPPLDFGSDHRFLVAFAEDGRLGRLLPLYFVLSASALALAWVSLKEQPRAIPRMLAFPAAAFFAFAFVSLLWADDVEAGANLLLFFTLPFVVLLAVVARSPFPAWLTRSLGIAAVTLASVFALIGLFQAATHKLFFYAENLQVSNANTDYFRVTSLFGDPSLYGRHVVLGIGIVLVALAVGRGKQWPAIGLLVVMWAGLLFSYSQSSMVALIVVTLAVAAATGDRQVRRAVVAAGVIALIAAVGFLGARLATGDSLKQVTSDRAERVEDTVRVIAHHPLAGVGIAGQPQESRRLSESTRPTENFVSHTTPLTVAAELGVIGLALYVWLLVGGAQMILAVRRYDNALGLALGASFLALFVHALSYSGFLEDPLTWVVLGVGAAFVATRPAGERHAVRAGSRRTATASG